MTGIVIDPDGAHEESGAPAAKKTAAPTVNQQTHAGNKMHTFDSILAMSRAGGTLAGDSAEYIDSIQATFDRISCGITNKQLSISDKVVVAFYNRDKTQAISLTLADPTIEAQREDPTSEIAHQIGGMLGTDGVKLVNNIVVLPQDYVHAPKMAREILLTIENAGTKAFEQANKSILNGKFKVTMNLGDVNTITRSCYPLESMPRADIGLIVWTRVSKEIPSATGQEWEWEPVIIMTGYTQFIDLQTGHGYMFNSNVNAQPKITPRVTVTNIQTSIRCPVMYGLAMLFAAEYFVKRNGWLLPYEKFGKDIPNLGALVPDAKGKPCNLANQAQLQEFLSNPNIMSAPTLAVDVTEGRPGLAAQWSLIENIPGSTPGNELLQRLAKFMANDGQEVHEGILNSGSLVGQRDVEFIGYINGSKDSRVMDYLQLIADGITDIQSAVRFLYIAPEPQLKGQMIKEFTDYISLFKNTTVLLNPHVIAQIGTADLDIEVESDMQSQQNNIGRYAEQFYSDFSSLGTIGKPGNGPGYYTNYTTPYQR